MILLFPGYVLDANVIIDARRRYPQDTFPQLWECITELVEHGRLICPREVLHELEKGDDDCATWAKSLPGFVVEAGDNVICIVSQITKKWPEWVSKNRNRADPWIIAEAEDRRFRVITHEKKGPPSIPSICKERRVRSMDLLDMMSTEGWTF